MHSTHTTDLEFAHDSKGAQPPNDANGAVTKLPLKMVEFDIYQSVERLIHGEKSNPDFLDGNSLHSCSTEVLDKGKSAEFSLVGEYLSSLSRGASKQHQSSMYNLLGRSNTLLNSPNPANVHNGVGSGDFDGIYISSCGHVVHQECHERYLLSLKQR